MHSNTSFRSRASPEIMGIQRRIPIELIRLISCRFRTASPLTCPSTDWRSECSSIAPARNTRSKPSAWRLTSTLMLPIPPPRSNHTRGARVRSNESRPCYHGGVDQRSVYEDAGLSQAFRDERDQVLQLEGLLQAGVG